MTLSKPNDFDAEELPFHNKERGLDDFRRDKLAEHQLGSTEFSGVLESSVSPEEPEVVNVMHFPRVSGKSTSTNEAIQYLTTLAAESNSGCVTRCSSIGHSPTLAKAVLN